jgi:hypothetical protein
MKNFKNTLRIMITLASMLGFLGGWATLAHSRKPIQPTQAQSQQVQALEPLAPLDPLPAIDGSSSNNNNGNGQLRIITPSNLPARRNRAAPLFSTTGS